MQQLKIAKAAQDLRLATVKADAAEREAVIAEGNILPRDEFTLSIIEHLQIASAIW